MPLIFYERREISIKIGITERGDASIDTSWADKLKNCDGAIIITKNISRWVFDKLSELHHNHYPVILHATCTGWGGTCIEPNVPDFKTQITGVKMLIDNGFPRKNIVLRIDPIIPSVTGMQRVYNVIEYAKAIGVINPIAPENNVRIRISILDEYRHVKQRLKNLGLNTVYPGDLFQAPAATFQYAEHCLADTQAKLIPGMKFYTCAETKLNNPKLFNQTGCISKQDLEIMGLNYSSQTINPQNRNGCLCLGCKYELLTSRTRCPHKCAYCYWKD